MIDGKLSMQTLFECRKPLLSALKGPMDIPLVNESAHKNALAAAH
jgi:hypothetical protein